MNKKNGIILSIVIVFVIGGGIFIWSNLNHNSSTTSNEYEANRTSTNVSVENTLTSEIPANTTENTTNPSTENTAIPEVKR